MIPETVLYPARLVRTLDPARPTGEALLVRGDRVLGVGTEAELQAYRPDRTDQRYADAVLLPGFVEAHSHAASAGMWAHTYVGRFTRTSPDGRTWPGCDTVEAVIERLRAAEAELDPGQTLRAWGFDPLYFPDETLDRYQLDRVSSDRPIHLGHTSGHVSIANSALLAAAGVDASTDVIGVVKDAAGQPTGELQEFAAMGLVADFVGTLLGQVSVETLQSFAQDGVNQGTTTLTDLGSKTVAEPEGERVFLEADGSGQFPARLSVFHFGSAGASGLTPGAAVQRLRQLQDLSTDKVRFGHVKLMLDGSIQGFTARLLAPGYLGGQPNGIWTMAPEEFEEALRTFHEAGLLVHVHCNGDQATQLFVETMERVLTAHPRPDHRHTVTHSQLTTAAQYRRMATLGMGANIFANHTWAWGDQHHDFTVGPDRAARMNAARTALDAGVTIALHCDTPVTPLGPLTTVQHAVTRRTPSGRVLGEPEKISVAEALRAVTIGPAYLLKMDHEIGSLEPGKFADVAVLEEDPCTVPAEEIGNIRVRGTMVGGEHHASAVAKAVAVP